MLMLPTVLSREDFDHYNWREVINECEKKDCLYYESRLFKKAEEARKANDLKAEGVFALLGAISSFILNLDSKETPFGPLMALEGSRYPIPDDITDEQLAVLKELVPHVSDAELRARIADVLWFRKCGREMAECAIESYLESVKTLEKIGQWERIDDRIERAMQLALRLNNKSLISKVVGDVESLLKRCDNDHNQIPTLRLMRITRKNRRALKGSGLLTSLDYANLAARAAIRTEQGSHWMPAESFWSIAAAWFATHGDVEKEIDARKRATETQVRQSEEALTKRSPPDYQVAAFFLRDAVVAYRKLPGTEKRVEELNKLLLDYQERASRHEMHTISVALDEGLQEAVERVIEQTKEQIRGKTVQEALFTIAMLATSPNEASIRKTIQDAMKEHPLPFLFPRVMLNDVGKVVAYNPGGAVAGNSCEEAQLLAEMFTHAQLSQQYKIVSVIEPARRQIVQEHSARVEDLRPFVINNPFIPPGREYIFARGLYAGLVGDCLVSAHLLIPQLENSIRWLLYQHGEIASKLDDSGIQQERDLNKLLYAPYADTLKHILGEDLVFDLRGLLVEEYGSNLRNKLAHGLMNSNSFSSSQLLYLWWVVLHLCTLPLLNRKKSSAHEPVHDENGEL